jgi:hypothetical protein
MPISKIYFKIAESNKFSDNAPILSTLSRIVHDSVRRLQNKYEYSCEILEKKNDLGQ